MRRLSVSIEMALGTSFGCVYIEQSVWEGIGVLGIADYERVGSSRVGLGGGWVAAKPRYPLSSI